MRRLLIAACLASSLLAGVLNTLTNVVNVTTYAIGPNTIIARNAVR